MSEMKLQTWFTDAARRPVSLTSAMTSKVKGQGRKVASSAWQVLAHKSRTKRSRNTNIAKKVAYPTGNKAHQFQGQRSKVKVTTSTNAEMGSASYLSNGKAYECKTWYIDGVRRSVSSTSAMTSKVKGQGRDVTWCVWQVLAHKPRTQSPRNTEIGRNCHIAILPTLRAILRTCFRVKGQRSRSARRPKVYLI